MRKKLPLLVMLLLAVQFLGADTIETIQIEGNKKISRETIQFYIKSRPGGIFDEDKLREDFKVLWETGFFENIRIESENGAAGKIVRFIFSENPLISTVTYKMNKKVKENDIVQKLLDGNITIQAFSYYSPAKIRRAKKIITDMLLEKGFNQASVTIDEKIEE
ncbi:MAG TPA: POTRA domain-containing protein, partial [Candidatus Binatia bacterium]|nr:POTRA domain-containing protein [Candidatus Binatia bacterium]